MKNVVIKIYHDSVIDKYKDAIPKILNTQRVDGYSMPVSLFGETPKYYDAWDLTDIFSADWYYEFF